MLTAKRKLRLHQQGYGDLSDGQLEAIAPWLRLYPTLCAVLIVLATVLASSALMFVLAFIAMVSAIYKHHPFDVAYNLIVSPLLKTPPLPPNRIPRRAACGVAAIGLGSAGVLMALGYVPEGQVVGAMVGMAATIKASTDYCPVSHAIYRASPEVATRKAVFGE